MEADVPDGFLICDWCGEVFERPHQRGPTPRYCSASHRQRAYEQRRVERLVEQRAKQLTEEINNG